MRCDDNRPKAAGDCKPCEGGVRNHYFSGKMLTVADYEAEQRYAIQRRRMINREMFGWGVVSGFRVASGLDRPHGQPGPYLTIGEGFAFDQRGRELAACRDTVLHDQDDVVWLKEKGKDVFERCNPPQENKPAPLDGDEGAGPTADGTPSADERGDASHPREEAKDDTGGLRIFLLCAHYAEQRIDGVIIDEGCGEQTCQPNRICETVVYSLREGRSSGLPPCAPFGRPTVNSPIDTAGWPRAHPADPPKLVSDCDRGPHKRLADWSLARADATLCGDVRLHPLGDGLWFDPAASVALAYVEVGFVCGRAVITKVVDAVGPRRLAQPNNVLFDLIRGCDLTRIQNVGWHNLLNRPDRRALLDDFVQMFVNPNTNNPVTVDTRLWVQFTGPVQVASLTPHVITITLLHPEDSDRDAMFRVQVMDIKVAPTLPTDPPGTTRAFRPVVDGNWWYAEIDGIRRPRNATRFDSKDPTTVEIVVRGGLIVDADGQLVAAGGGYLPSRPGWPGSDFISALTLVKSLPRPAAPRQSEGSSPASGTSRRGAGKR